MDDSTQSRDRTIRRRYDDRIVRRGASLNDARILSIRQLCKLGLSLTIQCYPPLSST